MELIGELSRKNTFDCRRVTLPKGPNFFIRIGICLEEREGERGACFFFLWESFSQQAARLMGVKADLIQQHGVNLKKLGFID